ncbi:unnamed protein product [Brassica oleracea]
MCVSCRFRGKQNDLTVPHESKERGMPYLYGCDDHLYTFEDSFCLDQDCPEAEDATYSELVFEFKVSYKNWKVKACGVQLLEDEEESGRDEDEDDEADDGDNDEVEEEIQDDVEKTQEGEEPRRDDEDGETRSTTSEKRFLDLKVLVVHVDKIEQLDALVKQSQWFGSGNGCIGLPTENTIFP